MPVRAPRICGCGYRIASGDLCPCQRKRAAERKARADQHRPSARERGYDTKWEKESEAYRKANPRCCRCGAPTAVVDHVVPHRGDKRLFWSRSNWQPLCQPCHSRAKQAAEHRGVVADFRTRPGTGGGSVAQHSPELGKRKGDR